MIDKLVEKINSPRRQTSDQLRVSDDRKVFGGAADRMLSEQKRLDVERKDDGLRAAQRECFHMWAHSAVDGDVVNHDAAFGQQLLDVPLRQAVPRVPPDRLQTASRVHRRREPEPCKTGRGPRHLNLAAARRPTMPEFAIGQRIRPVAGV